MYCQLKVYDWVFLVGFGCWGVLNTFIEESKEQYETISSTSNTTFGYYFFSNIGYRYISTKGFLFRIGLSPSFSFNDKHGITKEPFIYPYISFGYSF